MLALLEKPSHLPSLLLLLDLRTHYLSRTFDLKTAVTECMNGVMESVSNLRPALEHAPDRLWQEEFAAVTSRIDSFLKEAM